MKILNFLSDLEFKDDNVAIKVLVNDEQEKEVRIAFKDGQNMKKHSAPYPIAVQTIYGSIEFGVGEKTVILNEIKTDYYDHTVSDLVLQVPPGSARSFG